MSTTTVMDQKYLTEIKQYSAKNRPVIYLDKTWFDTYDTIKEGWNDFQKNVKQILHQMKAKQ